MNYKNILVFFLTTSFLAPAFSGSSSSFSRDVIPVAEMASEIAFTGGFNQFKTSDPGVICITKIKNNVLSYQLLSKTSNEIITSLSVDLKQVKKVVREMDRSTRAKDGLTRSRYILAPNVEIILNFHPIHTQLTVDNQSIACFEN